jgi:hypothetical protein
MSAPRPTPTAYRGGILYLVILFSKSYGRGPQACMVFYSHGQSTGHQQYESLKGERHPDLSLRSSLGRSLTTKVGGYCSPNLLTKFSMKAPPPPSASSEFIGLEQESLGIQLMHTLCSSSPIQPMLKLPDQSSCRFGMDTALGTTAPAVQSASSPRKLTKRLGLILIHHQGFICTLSVGHTDTLTST